MIANTGQASTQIPGFTADQYPLVKEVFWILNVNCDAFFGGGTLTFDINSTQVLNVGLSPGSNLFDWTTTATNAYTDGSGILLDFQVN
jgi:hypothetical protein